MLYIVSAYLVLIRTCSWYCSNESHIHRAVLILLLLLFELELADNVPLVRDSCSFAIWDTCSLDRFVLRFLFSSLIETLGFCSLDCLRLLLFFWLICFKFLFPSFFWLWFASHLFRDCNSLVFCLAITIGILFCNFHPLFLCLLIAICLLFRNCNLLARVLRSVSHTSHVISCDIVSKYTCRHILCKICTRHNFWKS